MRTQLISAADLTERDLGQWRELAATAVEPNPFHEPEYVLPLAEAVGRRSDVHVLIVSDGAGWQACLPVRSGRFHRIPVRALSAWRGHPLYSLLGTPLVSPSRPSQALAALLQGMLTVRPVSFAALEWTSVDGPLADSLLELLERRTPAPICFERFQRAALRRRSEPTYLEETLSSKHRRELRRQRRKLSDAIGSEPVTVDRAGHDEAYDDFIALEATGEKRAHGTVLAANGQHARFFREACRGFAEQGRLQLLSLQAGGHTLASKCNLISGDTIFCLKIAYDERWSSLSPGIQLEVDMLKLFHEGSIADRMDSCADPGNPMINRLWPDRRALATYLLPSDGPLRRITTPGLLMVRSLRDRRNAGRTR